MKNILIAILLAAGLTALHAQDSTQQKMYLPKNQPGYGRSYNLNEAYTYLKEHLIYPKYAYDNDIKGYVVISFTVDANDWVKEPVTNIQVVRSVHPALDYASIVMVRSMPDEWRGTSTRGPMDTVRITMSIQFEPDRITPDQVTDRLDRRINQLMAMDSLALDSLLYRSKPVAREPKPEYKPKHSGTYTLPLPSVCCYTVSGTVYLSECRNIHDKTKEPIQGAWIVEDQTPNGVITDENGNFTIKVMQNSKIRISLFGYKDAELEVNEDKEKVKIVLCRDFREMYE